MLPHGVGAVQGNLGAGLGLNVWEVLIVLVIVLVICGAGKLPRVMGDLGKGIRSFKTGLKDHGQLPAESASQAETTGSKLPPLADQDALGGR